MLDDVHRGHRQPRAVDHAADRAVQLDIAQSGRSRAALRVTLLVWVSKLLNLRVTPQRVVIDIQLGVDGLKIAGVVDHERVDFREGRIDGHERLNQALCHADKLAVLRAAQAKRETKLSPFPVWQSDQGINGHSKDGRRIPGRHVLDVDTAFGAGHQHQRLCRAVDHDTQVQLASDRHGRRDKHAAHWLTTDVQAKNLRSCRAGFLRRVGQFHAAGLAPSAGQHLGLYDDLSRKRGGGSGCLGG